MTVIATIDLGSNSFHLTLSKLTKQGKPRAIHTQKMKVQLRSGIDSNGHLTPEVQAKALECFRQFADTLQKYNAQHVKVIGTYTLRAAQDTQAFIKKAEETLGHPIDIISGEEEARIIYVGATHGHNAREKQLIIDIGGGSTELIIGQEHSILDLVSLDMGCVSFQDRYFPNGTLSDQNFKAGLAAAHAQLAPLTERFQALGWQTCLGSSGTIKTIANILAYKQYGRRIITLKGMHRLINKLLTFKSVADIKLPGLREDRANILAGGLVILTAIFESLKIKTLRLSRGGIREGMLYEFAHKIKQEGAE